MARARRAAQGGGDGDRRRAIVGWAGVGLVLLLVFVAFVLRLAEDAVRSEAEGRVRTTAELTARLAGEQSARFGEVAQTYAQRLRDVPRPRRARLPVGDRVQVELVLTALRSEVRGLDAVAYTDSLGRVVAAVPAAAAAPGTDLSGTDWFRGLGDGLERYLSRADVPRGARGPATTLAVPVTSAAGERTGILAVTATNRFQTLADAAAEDVKLTLTDQAGAVVGRTGAPPTRLVTRAQDPLVRAAMDGRTGVRVREVDGRPTVSGYAGVPGTGYTVSADVPASKAFEDVTRLRATLLIGTALIAFLLLWLLPLLTLRLARARERIVVSERFQADLLPSDLPTGVLTHYVASEKRMLLGGDFLDAVRTPDGGLAVLVGDVCGHGPRAAALAARLRASWRTLAIAGVPLDRLDVLDAIIVSERPDEDLFATVVVAHVDADGRRLRWAVAGHPPALLAADGVVLPLDGDGRGPALGLVEGVPWPVAERDLPERWTLVLYTDGLIEARAEADGERLEVLGLQALVEDARGADGVSPEALVQAVAQLADADGQGLDDDLAILVVDERSTRRQAPDSPVQRARRG
ncbi:MAG: phosphatase [Solirubrobacterales bacterium]|nr:phosphatase [Solirubrobacterales bacterium]